MRRFSIFLSILFSLGAFCIVYAIDPHKSTLFPPCPFKTITGLRCPGCGSTRAVHLLLHGRTGEALDRNLLMVVSIPILLAMIVWPSITTKPWVAWCSFAVLIIYGIARNLPLPFFLLKP